MCLTRAQPRHHPTSNILGAVSAYLIRYGNITKVRGTVFNYASNAVMIRADAYMDVPRTSLAGLPSTSATGQLVIVVLTKSFKSCYEYFQDL